MDKERLCELYFKSLSLNFNNKYSLVGIRYARVQLDDRYLNLVREILVKMKIIVD